MKQVFGRRNLKRAGISSWFFVLIYGLAFPTVGFGEESPAFQKLGDAFRREIRPVLNQHCMKCHAADVQEGTLDLEQFATLNDVRRSTTTWLKIAEMLDNGEMPPKKAPQPTPERRQRLRGWVADYLRAEALRQRRRPGPSRSAPAGKCRIYVYASGFDRCRFEACPRVSGRWCRRGGIYQYRQCAGDVAGIAFEIPRCRQEDRRPRRSLPDGMRFSPSATRRDWTDEVLAKIRSFYGQFTDAGGGTQVNLQGIVFGTNQGGRLPLERYLEATRERPPCPGIGGKDMWPRSLSSGTSTRNIWASSGRH